MEDNLIGELIEVIELQEKLISELKFKVDNLKEINDLLEKYVLLTEKQLETEKKKLPTINYN
jgi:hypothetical protein